MPKPLQDDALRHFSTLLRRWDGSEGRLWKLTTSHPTLTIRLEQQGRVGNLEVSCADPVHVQGPVRWKSSHVVIERFDDMFVVRDDSVGLRVQAHNVEVAENRRPENAFTRNTP